MTERKENIIILGAGVIGLQTAISLLSTDRFTVTIVAQHFPGDLSIEYTSPWADGHWRSHTGSSPAESELRDWDAETYRYWSQLLTKKGKDHDTIKDVEREIGLGFRESVMYWSSDTVESKADGSGIWWRDCAREFSILKKEEFKDIMLRDADGGSIEHGIKKLGAQFVQEKIDNTGRLEQLIQGVIATAGGVTTVDGVVLATGLSSRHYLEKDEAEKLFPIRGQTMLVRGESNKFITHYFPCDNEDVMYIVPRPSSGTTIIGGCKQKDNWNATEDAQLTKRVLERAKMLVPELLGPDGEFELLSVQVGYRPGRVGGPRVELEVFDSGLKVVHAYGHSGAGYQSSVGSAAKVVRVLSQKLVTVTGSA